MANKMLIDATHPEETRVVVLRGSRVEEFDFESAAKQQLKGNIYLAKVTRVEPSLQAAFVEYGGNRHGFLAFSEIHPDYYQIPTADRQALLAEEADAEHERARGEDRAAEKAARGGGRRRRRRRMGAQAAERRPDDAVTGDASHGLEHSASSLPEAATIVPAVDEVDDVHPATADVTESKDPPVVRPAIAESETGDPGEYAATASEQAPAPAVASAPARASERDMPIVPPVDEVDDTRPPAADVTESKDPPVDLLPIAESETGHAEDGDIRPSAAADEDDGDDDEHDDEEDEEAEEDVVEAVGGADALEEVSDRRERVAPRRYKIQEVIKRRQVLLVQVVKEERGNKGAALTTYLSLAGRYSVLMPNTARGGGISRKITDSEDRKRLKEIAQDLEVPEGMGVILRTAGASRTRPEVKRDFEYLLRLWENVAELTLKSQAPMLVYEEGSLVKRSIRDLYNKDIDEVVVAGDDAYREAKDFMRMLMPSHAKNVKPYRDDVPLFSRYTIESQLDGMLQPQVQLRSGGYIVLNQTEALVSIDVNSGRSTREHNIEDTALKTNLEAAEEIARQLRLRDLAGLVVIDFIDMEEKRNNRHVEKRLKDCLRQDRARIQIGRISHFGLLEMSRQRIRASVLESTTETCSHCGGTGHVRSPSSSALQILRMIEEALIRDASRCLTARARTRVALYMLNQKRLNLRLLEERFGVPITVEADEHLPTGTPYVIEKGELAASAPIVRTMVRVDSVPPAAELEEPVDAEEDADDTANVAEAAETDREARDDGERRGTRRRRRRRGRENGGDGGGRDVDRPEPVETAGQEAAEDEAEEDDSAASGAPSDLPALADTGGDDESRRRRRGRRGGRRYRDESEPRERGERGPPRLEPVVWLQPGDEAPAAEPAVMEPIAAVIVAESIAVQGASPSDEPAAPRAAPEVEANGAGMPVAAQPASPPPAEAAQNVAADDQPPPMPRIPDLPEMAPPPPADDNRPKRAGWWSRR